jgi:hypothetical protein
MSCKKITREEAARQQNFVAKAIPTPATTPGEYNITMNLKSQVNSKIVAINTAESAVIIDNGTPVQQNIINRALTATLGKLSFAAGRFASNATNQTNVWTARLINASVTTKDGQVLTIPTLDVPFYSPL